MVFYEATITLLCRIKTIMESNKCIRLYADPVQINECKKKLKANTIFFSQLSKVLELAGNEVRLKILFLLEEESRLCPCDISDILGMSIPAVSQHLRKLKDGNVIEARREGQTIYYSLKEEHLKILKPFFKYLNQRNLKLQIA
jgi:DNA-binding transcriptional ArsR family regulator